MYLQWHSQRPPYSGDGDVQGAVQGQDGGLGAGGDQDGGWWI